MILSFGLDIAIMKANMHDKKSPIFSMVLVVDNLNYSSGKQGRTYLQHCTIFIIQLNNVNGVKNKGL